MLYYRGIIARREYQRVSVPPKILVVEDDVLVLSLLQKILERAGYRTLRAEDGSSALQILEEQQPDLIVLDLFLPGMNGLELLKFVKQNDRLKHTPIVVVSAHPNVAPEVYDSGVERILIKPVQPDELRETVRTLLEE